VFQELFVVFADMGHRAEWCIGKRCNRGLRACWGIMGNQGKQKEDGGRA